MSENTEPSPEQQEQLQHYIAYTCGRCETQFIGRGSSEAKFCYHCGALLTASGLQQDAAKQQVKKKKVVVAEDSQVLLNAFSKMILSMGHEVLEAHDGKEALTISQKEHPDLIITDLNMPRMSGMELIENLRKDDSLRDVPVVILTSESRSQTIAKGLNQGVVDYIVKDIGKVAEIRERLKKFL